MRSTAPLFLPRRRSLYTVFRRLSVDEDFVDADQNLTGWTIGAGAEYAFTNNWIGRVEYRYHDFSDDVLEGFGDVGVETNTLTVGVSYKF